MFILAKVKQFTFRLFGYRVVLVVGRESTTHTAKVVPLV